MGKQLIKKFKNEKLKTKIRKCYKHGKTLFYFDRINNGFYCLKCCEEWLNKQIDKPICTYPEDAKISKNKHTANCYRKIRTVFRDKYIEEKFDNPMQPAEYEFLQSIKKFLNVMEEQLLKKK